MKKIYFISGLGADKRIFSLPDLSFCEPIFNEEIPDNLIHIHGTADRLLPYSLVKATYTIENGTHVLPMDQHAQLSTLLRQLI